MEIEINLESFNKLYNTGDNILGTISIKCFERIIEFSKMNMILTVYIYQIGIIYNKK